MNTNTDITIATNDVHFDACIGHLRGALDALADVVLADGDVAGSRIVDDAYSSVDNALTDLRALREEILDAARARRQRQLQLSAEREAAATEPKPTLKQLTEIQRHARRRLRNRTGATTFKTRMQPYLVGGVRGALQATYWTGTRAPAQGMVPGKSYLIEAYDERGKFCGTATIRIPSKAEYNLDPNPARFLTSCQANA